MVQIEKTIRSGLAAGERFPRQIPEKNDTGMPLPGTEDEGHGLDYFFDLKVGHEDILLGNRYLCRDGSLLFVGPSGVGKSSAGVQMDVSWALGIEAFGIAPVKPMRILTIQAENDDGDLSEMVKGVIGGMRLTAEDRQMIGERTRYISDCWNTGDRFIAKLDARLAAFKPDIIQIDPLNGFLGADPKDVERLMKFCREGLNPLLKKHHCGLVVAHHTPKLNFRDSSKWRVFEWMYAGGGTADLTNWARAYLVIDPVTDYPDTFRFNRRQARGKNRLERSRWQSGL